jgi:hypothetical protein
MPRDSQATFTSATKAKIRNKYNNRCAICCCKLPKGSSECAHLFDRAGTGAKQVEVAIYVGAISPGYKRSSAENGMVQCPNCHELFTREHVALSPSPQILQYLVQYLRETDAADRKPLHEVFRLLREADQSDDTNLPNFNSILPFLGLFTLVILAPNQLNGVKIAAHHLPDLSILQGDQFIPAPADMSPDAPDVARIFDVLAIPDGVDAPTYSIPLLPDHAEFTHQRYWRVPARPEVMLMILMERIRHVTDPGCEEIKHARIIYCILNLNKVGVHEISVSSGSKRTSEDHDDDKPPRKLSRGGTSGESMMEQGKSGSKAKGARNMARSRLSSRRQHRTLRLKI